MRLARSNRVGSRPRLRTPGIRSGDRNPATGNAPRARGQSLVEFSMIVMPLFMVMLGIIQFGFVFNTYVTVTNAGREGARTGSVYVYDRNITKAQNDLARNEAIRNAVLDSMNLLSKTAPRFSAPGTWTQAGLVFTTGDLRITYAIPAGLADTNARVGQTVTVRVTYHQDLIVPIVSNFLPKAADGRLALIGESTMVIN